MGFDTGSCIFWFNLYLNCEMDLTWSRISQLLIVNKFDWYGSIASFKLSLKMTFSLGLSPEASEIKWKNLNPTTFHFWCRKKVKIFHSDWISPFGASACFLSGVWTKFSRIVNKSVFKKRLSILLNQWGLNHSMLVVGDWVNSWRGLIFPSKRSTVKVQLSLMKLVSNGENNCEF